MFHYVLPFYLPVTEWEALERVGVLPTYKPQLNQCMQICAHNYASRIRKAKKIYYYKCVEFFYTHIHAVLAECTSSMATSEAKQAPL